MVLFLFRLSCKVVLLCLSGSDQLMWITLSSVFIVEHLNIVQQPFYGQCTLSPSDSCCHEFRRASRDHSLSSSAQVLHLIAILMSGPRLDSACPRARCHWGKSEDTETTQPTGAKTMFFIYFSSRWHSRWDGGRERATGRRHGGVEEVRLREGEQKEGKSVEGNRAELLSDAINLAKREKGREIQAFLLILLVQKTNSFTLLKVWLSSKLKL